MHKSHRTPKHKTWEKNALKHIIIKFYKINDEKNLKSTQRKNKHYREGQRIIMTVHFASRMQARIQCSNIFKVFKGKKRGEFYNQKYILKK